MGVVMQRVLSSVSRTAPRAISNLHARTLCSAPAYENITSETRENGSVGLVTLNRPKALNALCDALIDELNDAMAKFEADDQVGAVVITGSEKSFAAGADIVEMAPRNYMDCYKSGMFDAW